MRIFDVTEVDDDLWQCAIARDDGSIIVTIFVGRDHLLQFLSEDTTYGTDPRLVAGAGDTGMLRH